MTRLAKIVMTIALAVSAVATAAGCSSSDSAPPPMSTTSVDPQAQNLLRSCADATKTLTSAHVVIALNGKFDRLGQASAVEGDAQASPLVLNGNVTYQNGAVAPLVVADDTVSVKQGGVWNNVGATSALVPPAIIDPRLGLPDLLDGTESAQSAGSEVINAVDTNRVTGTIPVEKAKDLLPEANGPADLTLWIRKSGEPVLVRALIALSANQSISVTLSNWDTPITVTTTPSP